MNQRPLSPHLGVYKLAYTMLLSGTHRITGLVATVGLLLFVWWLMALASGPDAYADAMKLLGSPFGRLVLAGFAFSVVYHFCNGIRHMLWDTGRGLERAQARRSGVVVVVSALLLTALVIWLGCAAMSSTGVP
jgi:succinate dehydrogenase / fumarate reductase cytochrome b subunit